MQKILMAAAVAVLCGSGAQAADLAAHAPPEVVATSATNWGGFYAGIFGGVAASNPQFSIDPTGGPTFATIDVTGNGFLGGGRIGYDFDAGPALLGVYGDIAATSIQSSISANAPGLLLGTSVNASSKLDWVGTIQAKLGMPVSDSLLVYAHGGFAHGHTSQTASLTIGGGGPAPFTASQDRNGWVLGAGVEFAVTNNLFFNTEYSYTDLGTAAITSFGVATLNEKLAYHQITAGLSYKF
jgi:outer membrane immunogenic protein